MPPTVESCKTPEQISDEFSNQIRKTTVSVIIPTFNGERFISQALDSIRRQSVLSQPGVGLEVLVVDDGSTDDTLKIVKSFSEILPLRILERPHSGNWVMQTNAAIRLAQGDYLSILHQDDLWESDRLDRLLNLAHKYPDAAVILHPVRFIAEDGSQIGLWRCPFSVLGRADTVQLNSPLEILRSLVTQNFISVPGPLIRKGALEKAGPLDETLWYTADWQLWVSLAQCGTWIYTPVPLASFRLHSRSQTIQEDQDRLARTSHFKQMESVQERVLESLRGEPDFKKLAKVARFSTKINAELHAKFHGAQISYWQLILDGLKLGPAGVWKFLHDSRFIERVGARIRVQRKLRSLS